MRRKRGKSVVLRETDRYWLAGLLEGDGCFTYTLVGRRKWPRIILQMTDEDVVSKVSALWGRKYHKQIPKPPRKPTYAVKITGYTALELMMNLKPLMGLRRQNRIEEISREFCTISSS